MSADLNIIGSPSLMGPMAVGAIAFVCMDWRPMGELLAAGRTIFSELKNLCIWNKTNGDMGSFYRSNRYHADRGGLVECDQTLHRFEQITGKPARLAATGQSFEDVAAARRPRGQ